MARTEIVRKRRKAMQNFLSNDIAELLKGGFDTNAYSKVIFYVPFESWIHSGGEDEFLSPFSYRSFCMRSPHPQ